LKGEANYGEWAFLGGVFISIIVGLGSTFIPVQWVPLVWGVLAALGLIVGFLNITEKEVNAFLIATVAMLTVVNSLTPIGVVIKDLPEGVLIVSAIGNFLSAIYAFIAPAAFIVAIRAIYILARTE
jgi:hypothetical protein